MNDIHALAIDKNTIYVPCNSENWKKCSNGDGFHRHGNSSNSFENREEGRSSHCSINYNNVIINDHTFRGKILKRIKSGWRKGNYIFESFSN
tara:strand:+ start:13027 stop:13302 length:276 start_codon:yes stop_codon:yes gene_type:complete